MVIQKVYFIAIYLVEVEYRMEVTTKLLYPLGRRENEAPRYFGPFS
jgi:hypothetical protein